MQIETYSDDQAEWWDTFCETAPMATFLHTRRYLSYHGERLADCSLTIREGDTWLGLLPAAASPTVSDMIVSHPGVTFGGLVHGGKLHGTRMLEALELALKHFARLGFRKLLYKCVPSIYHQVPSQDDRYALFRLGAIRVRCDLSATIDLNGPIVPSRRRQRSLKKALETGAVVTTADSAQISSLWSVLNDNLERKHNAAPVHSEAEIRLLAGRFPERIRFVVALLAGNVEAGVVLYIDKGVHHAQYIAASEAAYQHSLLDAVFDHCIAGAMRERARFFDFGISNEDQGRILNEGLYRFKTEFGGGGVVHEFYELPL